jgi:hypothetical protein
VAAKTPKPATTVRIERRNESTGPPSTRAMSRKASTYPKYATTSPAKQTANQTGTTSWTASTSRL